MRVTVRRRRGCTDNGQPIDSQFAASFVTIDGLFDIVLDARGRKAASLNATYDGVRGHPLQVGIDYVAMMADEEMYYTAGDFKARQRVVRFPRGGGQPPASPVRSASAPSCPGASRTPPRRPSPPTR